MSQLPADCLNEIFEYLYEYNDKVTLHSCLLVNRLWCEVSVRILWREDWGFRLDHHHTRDYSILIACLPNESKEILYKNGINIPPPTSKPQMFNYAAFCKVISIDRVERMVEKLELDYTPNPIDITFSSHPDCLENLSELICYSDDIYPEILNQLSQICSNIQTIYITFGIHISNVLIDLIISQNNLKHLILHESNEYSSLITDMIPLLTILSHNTLIKLELYYICDCLPSIDGITNLHELEIFFGCDTCHNHEDDFGELLCTRFPQLQILKFMGGFSNPEILIVFLEHNGEILKELDVNSNELNLTIAEVCRNLKILATHISHNDLNTLRRIFNNCQNLESLRVTYDSKYLNEYNLLKIIVGYSPKNFYELTLDYYIDVKSKLLPGELESLFISWTNRIPQKSLSLFVKSERENRNSLDKDEENMQIIENYIKLGAIRKFEVIHE